MHLCISIITFALAAMPKHLFHYATLTVYPILQTSNLGWSQALSQSSQRRFLLLYFWKNNWEFQRFIKWRSFIGFDLTCICLNQLTIIISQSLSLILMTLQGCLHLTVRWLILFPITLIHVLIEMWIHNNLI